MIYTLRFLDNGSLSYLCTVYTEGTVFMKPAVVEFSNMYSIIIVKYITLILRSCFISSYSELWRHDYTYAAFDANRTKDKNLTNDDLFFI